MPIQTSYYCIQSMTNIAKLAVEYRKVQALDELKMAVERQSLISESILLYTNLIYDDVKAIMHMYFKSAYQNLTFAQTASFDNMKGYLVQARNQFIEAISFEQNENLILTYLGLSLCQALTDDIPNSKISLSKINDVDFCACVLADDYDFESLSESLSSQIPYSIEFKEFFFHFYFPKQLTGLFSICVNNRPFEESFGRFSTSTFLRYKSKEEMNDIKVMFKFYIKAMISCGIFKSMYDMKETQDSIIQSYQLILFELFKKEIIKQFCIS